MWAEGPGGGHYENMIGDYASLGCGVFIATHPGLRPGAQDGDEITVVQDFGD
jgi:hypothetical protein